MGVYNHRFYRVSSSCFRDVQPDHAGTEGMEAVKSDWVCPYVQSDPVEPGFVDLVE